MTTTQAHNTSPEWTTRSDVLMILSTGLSGRLTDEASYNDPFEQIDDPLEGYLDEEILEDHIACRLDAYRILRQARLKGFTKAHELYLAHQEQIPEMTVNYKAVALADELLAIWHPDDILQFLNTFDKGEPSLTIH